MGSKTVPSYIYEAIMELNTIARDKAIVAQMGWIRALLPSFGPWGVTLAAGPTPGGLLAVFGLGTWSLTSGGNQCDCE